jgi:hypothetical protein
MGINVVCVAHNTTEKEGDNIRFIPKITGGSADVLKSVCDLVGYMEINNQGFRSVVFSPTGRHYGKNSANLPAYSLPATESPAWPLFLQGIIDGTLAHMNKTSESANALAAEIKTGRADLAGFDVFECTAFANSLQSKKGVFAALKNDLINKANVFASTCQINPEDFNAVLALTKASVPAPEQGKALFAELVKRGGDNVVFDAAQKCFRHSEAFLETPQNEPF